MFFVESAAVEITRLRRARRLEGEHITGALNPPIYQSPVPTSPIYRPMIDPGLPAAMKLESVQPLVSVFQRYEATILQRLFRILHELERLQRMRQGEQLPAPAALDVSVHHDTGMQVDTMPLPRKKPWAICKMTQSTAQPSPSRKPKPQAIRKIPKSNALTYPSRKQKS